MNDYEREEACGNIAPFLKPGDVINWVWHFNLGKFLWPPFLGVLSTTASWQIQRYQKRYFGNPSFYKCSHTCIYLGETGGSDSAFDPKAHTVFEVTSPKSKWTPLWDFCDHDIRILRFTPRSLAADDISVMAQAASRIVGTSYDYGQLLDFLLHEVAGYPREDFRLFDLGPERKVCSTGVMSLFTHLRKVRESVGDMLIPRLFDIVDVDRWRSAGVYDNIDQCLDPDAVPGQDRIRTPIERVAPAHFDNTDYFQNEFQLIARFRKGVRME